MGSFARPDVLELEAPETRAPASPPLAQASPEDVFLAWLVGLPEGADVVEAARAQIARLDRAVPLPAQALRLRALLEEATAVKPGGAGLSPLPSCLTRRGRRRP